MCFSVLILAVLWNFNLKSTLHLRSMSLTYFGKRFLNNKRFWNNIKQLIFELGKNRRQILSLFHYRADILFWIAYAHLPLTKNMTVSLILSSSCKKSLYMTRRKSKIFFSFHAWPFYMNFNSRSKILGILNHYCLMQFLILNFESHSNI